MPCRYILALPWRTLQRAGISASGPFSNYNLPRGESLSCLRRHWHFNIHQQEVYKNQKGCGFGVSLNPALHLICITHPCRSQVVRFHSCSFKSVCVRLLIFSTSQAHPCTLCLWEHFEGEPSVWEWWRCLNSCFYSTVSLKLCLFALPTVWAGTFCLNWKYTPEYWGTTSGSKQ